MRFRFFEYVFFVSAFGTVALFPAALPFMAFLRVAGAVAAITVTGISLIAALGIAWKNAARKSRALAAWGALAAGCAGLAASVAGQSMPPVFVAWGIVAFVAVLTFGAILARRFFRRVERDFRRNIAHVAALGLAANAVLLVLAAFCAALPPIVAGAVTAIVTFAALL